MKNLKRKTAILLVLLITFCLCACGSQGDVTTKPEADAPEAVQEEETVSEDIVEPVKEDEKNEEAAEEPKVEKNGEIYILVTSDVHCGVDQNFGYAGLYEVRKSLEDQDDPG